MIDILTGDVRTARVDVTETVADGVAAVEERHPEASIAVETPASAHACGMAELRLAVAELIENSVRHSERDRPSVRVTVEREGERGVVTVRDDAPRIPEMEARVLTGDHEMDDVYHSSGLGLWLVYWIVELSDGQVTVAPADGQGNAVRLDLPAMPE
jgi:signal transduction histidine kinase